MKDKKKIGLLLSGCGRSDGSEIHETVLTILFLNKAGVKIVFIAPDIQFNVVNPLTNENTNETRSLLVEACRISRGEINNITNIQESDLDAIILPGGSGPIKNLSNFAEKGSDAQVNQEVEKLIIDMNKHDKPIGAICIAPVIVAKILAHKNISVTIGNDKVTASKIEAMGCKHVECAVKDIIIDQADKVVTTPAYMLGPEIKDIAVGIEKLVNKIIELA